MASLSMVANQSAGAPSSWSQSHGLADLEQQIINGIPLTEAQRNAMWQISSAPQGSSDQALYSDFVARIQDRESDKGALHDLGLGGSIVEDLVDAVIPNSIRNPGNNLVKDLAAVGASAAAGGYFGAGGEGAGVGGSAATDASTGLYAGESANAGAGAYGATGGGATGYAAGSSPMLLADSATTMTDVGPGYGAATTGGEAPLDIYGSTASTPGYSTEPGVWDPAGNYTMQGNWQTGGNWWDKYVDPKYLPYLKSLADLAGKAAPAALGAYGANQQANAYGDLANKYLAIGAPSRARYEASYMPGFSMENDPGYKDSLDQTTKATLHGMSVTGNPSGSPNAWEQTLKDVNAKFAYPALQDFRRINAGAGGLAALTSAAPSADAASVNAGKSVYDSLGAGAADIFSSPRSLSDLLREFKRAGY